MSASARVLAAAAVAREAAEDARLVCDRTLSVRLRALAIEEEHRRQAEAAVNDRALRLYHERLRDLVRRGRARALEGFPCCP